MSERPLRAIVIATASGAPMRSERPKPLHLLCGRPMLSWVLEALADAGAAEAVVVTGAQGDWVAKRVMEDPPSLPVRFVEQTVTRGTADAALAGLSGFDHLDDEGDLILVPADLPLVTPETLTGLAYEHVRAEAACTVLTGPAGSSRSSRPVIDRDRREAVVALLADPDGRFTDPDREVGLGVYCIRHDLLAPAARRSAPFPGSRPHDLANLVAVLAESGHGVATAPVEGPSHQVDPVDHRLGLADAEARLRRRINRHWLARGVTMIDPERTYIDATVRLGVDVTLFPGTMLQGTSHIGDGCEIGPDTRLDRCTVGNGSVVEKTMGRGAMIGSGCRVGPFAVVEPGVELPDGTITGPFYAAPGD